MRGDCLRECGYVSRSCLRKEKDSLSTTLVIFGRSAKLVNGRWKTSDPQLRQLLNIYTETLTIPSHYPPQSREQLTAEAVVRDLGGRIIEQKPDPLDDDRMSDGESTVY